MRTLVPALVLLAACAASAPPERPVAPVTPLPPGPDDVSGPYVHENLAVFVMHGAATDARDFLTLDEGLKAGTVAVTEQERAQVNQLQIENRSDRALFLQEGDRLKGGKQDRIIGSSLVIPPTSGVLPVPSFCIEQGRWAGLVMDFAGPVNAVQAGKAVRLYAKVGKNQSGVWEQVARTKGSVERYMGTAMDSTSSLNESLDRPETKKAIEAYEAALGKVLDGSTDAIGVAFVLNGKLEEACVYPNTGLVRRLYGRLLSSYALAAAIEKNKVGSTVSQADVVAFMRGEGSARSEAIDRNNILVITECVDKVACETKYEGAAVHRQWFRKEK